MAMTWLQLRWVHEISQSALASGVVLLGIVIMLELRSIRSMKRTLDSHLARVFEQLDLLRLDHSPQEPQVLAPVPVLAAQPASASGANPYAAAAAMASSGVSPEEIARRCGLAAGEVRLLASMAAARSDRRET